MAQSRYPKERGTSAKTYLPAGYKPADCDVICGRGKDCFNHTGNRRYRETVHKVLPKYVKARTKTEKGLMVLAIIRDIRSRCVANKGTGFLRLDRKKDLWYEIGDDAAREKIGHTIRETLTTNDPAKKAQRLRQRAICRAKRQWGQEKTPAVVARLQGAEESIRAVMEATQTPSVSITTAPIRSSLQSLGVVDSAGTAPSHDSPLTPLSIPTSLNILNQKKNKSEGDENAFHTMEVDLCSPELATALDGLPEPFSCVSECDGASGDMDNGVTGCDADAVLAAIPPELTSYSSGNWFSDEERANLEEIMSAPTDIDILSSRRLSDVGFSFCENELHLDDISVVADKTQSTTDAILSVSV